MEQKSEADPQSPIVIIDHGTRYTKFGLSTDPTPQKVRTVVGYPIVNGPTHSKEFYIGDEAISHRPSASLTLKYPYLDGMIQSIDDIEKIWLHVFSVLKVDPKEAVLFLTQSYFGHPDGTKKAVFQAFERLCVKRVIVCNKSTLPIFQTKKITGLVIDSGEEYTYVAAVYRGHALQDRVLAIPLAGARVTAVLQRMLLGQNHVLDKEVQYGFKEKHSYVSCTHEEAVSAIETVKDKLSDEQVIDFLDGMFTKSPEVLFEPPLPKEANSGLPKVACELIEKCVKEVRKDLYGHIVLCGGNTLIRGFPERFEKELKDEYSRLGRKIEDINVVVPAEREFGAWKGAVEVTKMPNFMEQCISQDEFDEKCETMGQYKYDYGTSQSESTSSGA